MTIEQSHKINWCWSNGYKILIVPINNRGQYYLMLDGQKIKNRETDNYIHWHNPTRKLQGTDVYVRLKEAYENIYKLKKTENESKKDRNQTY